MPKIPKAVSKAMDSLTARYNDDGIDRWGKPHEKIENVLPPTAWQLEVFHKFRDKLNESKIKRKEHLIKEIRLELKKRGIKDKKKQIRYLYSVGLASQNICQIVELPKSTSDNYIMKYRREKGISKGKSHNSTSFYDALILIRSNMTGEHDETFRNHFG